MTSQAAAGLRIAGAVAGCSALLLLAPLAPSQAGVPALSPASEGEGEPRWSYSGDTGPQAWGELDPDWALCADGTMQSPVDIGGASPRPLSNLDIQYAKSPTTVVDTGHTIEGVPDHFIKPSFLTIGNTQYRLKQFHFHAPSEHQVNGRSYPLEFHFVHADKSDQIAVIGVFVEVGAPAGRAWRPFLASLTRHVNEGDDRQIRMFDWPALLPDDQQTIRYSGSLTTPGCSEGVRWNLFTATITMSQAQINRFTREYDGNRRPLQPLNDRRVSLDSTPGR